MATNDEKLSKFNAAINHYAEEQRRKIEQEVSEFKKRELEEAEVEVLTEAYHLIQKEMAEMRNNITREMAHREMDSRRKLLNQRRKIMEEVFSKASQELLSYTETPAYCEKLKKSAQELASVFAGAEGKTVLCLKPEDLKKYETIVRDSFHGSCEITADADILIGGIRGYNSQMGVMADETLDSLLADQRGWFEENAGMIVV